MNPWHIFWIRFLWSLAGFGLLIVAIIWVVDPYRNLPFSLPLDRAPAASNQRYAYPAIARDPAFDSLMVGTSTMRLIPPERLDALFDARFANLSMNSATAYEQMRIGQLFASHHPVARYLIVGIDIVWCEDMEAPEKYTFRRFPEWMYDGNPWNDVAHLLEFKTFEVVGRQAGYMLGLRDARYGRDGYRSFLPPPEEYDLGKARQNIYGNPEGRPQKTEHKAAQTPGPEPVFGSHAYLKSLLRAFPPGTRKLLVFVPYHVYRQYRGNTREARVWNACRNRVSGIAKHFENTTVLDFMITSPITTRDENYWDPLHYSNVVADRLAGLIARGADGQPAPNGEYRVLFSSR